MKISILSLLIVVIVLGNLIITKAQCSDAGVCSVGGHSVVENISFLNISVLYKFGYSGKEDDVKYHSFQIDARYNLLVNTSLQLLMPYNIQSGPLGDVNGIGDLIVSAKQNLFRNDNSFLEAAVGVKLATGKDNKDNLPMAYQPGLGSNDFIFALNFFYNQIEIGVGYQLAGKRNINFIRLKRGDDLLVRASYNFILDNFTIMPQLLFIKKLSKSNNFIPEAMAPIDVYVDVAKSDQSQLNLLTRFRYQINDNALVADIAIPFIKREVNVDGLTRSFSASIGILFKIN